MKKLVFYFPLLSFVTKIIFFFQIIHKKLKLLFLVIMLFKFVIVCIYFYITINLVVSFPIQLIVSDEFNKLSITNEGKEFLLKINNKVEVVSITGPYHSGKSLVLNTLLNIDQNENFKVDNKISSTTKGIWFNTRLLNNSNNDKQVLLLDTEGFSSIENNKDFDSSK